MNTNSNSLVSNEQSETSKYPFKPYKTRDNHMRLYIPISYENAHKDAFKRLGGTKNTQLRCGPGWTFSMETEDDLKQYFDSLEPPNPETIKHNIENKLTNMEKNAKSRKQQHRYHRATSDTEDDDKVTQYYKRYSKSPKNPTPPIRSDSECESYSEDEKQTEFPTFKPSRKQLQNQIEQLQKQLEELKNKE